VLENLYGGTFKHLATPFPNKIQRPLQGYRLLPITYKIIRNYKGLEAHLTPFLATLR